jgi:cytosine permease
MTSHTTGSGQEPIHRTTSAESDTRISMQHDYALDPVPADRRRGIYSLVAVWVGWAISVSSFLVGGAVGAGTTFGTGFTAILLGNAVLALIGGAIGYIGYRTGLTTYLASRILFGVRGSAVPSIVLGILAMGFIGVLMDAFGTAMHGLVTDVPWTAWVILFAVAVTATAVFGFKGLAVLSVVAAPLMLVFALYSLLRIGGTRAGSPRRSTPYRPLPSASTSPSLRSSQRGSPAPPSPVTSAATPAAPPTSSSVRSAATCWAQASSRPRP